MCMVCASGLGRDGAHGLRLLRGESGVGTGRWLRRDEGVGAEVGRFEEEFVCEEEEGEGTTGAEVERGGRTLEGGGMGTGSNDSSDALSGSDPESESESELELESKRLSAPRARFSLGRRA